MPFTEFFAQTTGSNLNAGSTTSDAASRTYASGSWVASTGVFTVASGNPSSDGVLVGDFASVYADGSSVTGFVGRVTAVSSTTITLSLTAKAGTAPTDGTNNRTLKIGGAWQGPSGTVGFPFGFVQTTLTNVSGHRPRVNLKAGTYAITAAITHSQAGPVKFQGYASTPGDGGRATIDGGTSGASYTLLTVSGAATLQDLEFAHNGATGNAVAVLIQTNPVQMVRCVVHDVRGTGIKTGTTSEYVLIECEAYGCNQSNTSNTGCYEIEGLALVARCIAHTSPQANCHGYIISPRPALLYGCIAHKVGAFGFFSFSSSGAVLIVACDAYDCGNRGFYSSSGSADIKTVIVESTNIIKCGNGGMDGGGPAVLVGRVINCGFGAGSQANGGPDIQSGVADLEAVDNVIYPANATPWVDSANGDFRVRLHEAKRAGRGGFLQTKSGYGGTVGYPDIGAAQAYATGAVRMEGGEE